MNILDNVYMIVMSDNPVSRAHRNRALHSWKRNGITPILFEATTPTYMDQGYGKQLVFVENKASKGAKKSGVKPFTPTEKAVWCSHFRLWQKCYNSGIPLIVIEHDIKLRKPIDFSFLEENIDHYVIPLCQTRIKGVPKIRAVLPGGAYFITPNVAKRLIVQTLNYVKEGGITCNSDHVINKNILNVKNKDRKAKFKYVCCEQNIVDELGVTVDHGKGVDFTETNFDEFNYLLLT